MIRYVIGFLFSEDGRNVALIRKNKPQWQAGLLNGIGGKIEEGETSLQAMHREFLEEAGVQDVDWEAITVVRNEHFSLEIFRAFSEEVWNVASQEEEQVGIYGVRTLNTPEAPTVDNLRWIIPMLLDRDLRVQGYFSY